MKDLPHHIKKLNRRVIRSVHREELEEENYDENTTALPPRKKSLEEQRKIEKRTMREERLSRTPIHPSEEERNRKMRARVPVFDRNDAKPRASKPTKKKTPRI